MGTTEKDMTIGAGGNVTISPGDGAPPGGIIFQLADDHEVLRFDHDGKVYVRGEEVDDNAEIYVHLRRWLRLAHIIPSD